MATIPYIDKVVNIFYTTWTGQTIKHRAFSLPNMGPQHTKAVSASDVVVAALAGVVASVAIVPVSVLALLTFLFACARSALRRKCDSQPAAAIINLIAMGLTFGGIVTFAACYRPAKKVEHELQRPITLPSIEMSLAELAHAFAYDRQEYPIHVSLRFADSQKDKPIRLPSRSVTVAEFLAAIESQTSLRGSFRHCGNGYTVLNGGDCCFGLVIRDRSPQAAGDVQFDVDQYAAGFDP